jgi:hypothetical protein
VAATECLQFCIRNYHSLLLAERNLDFNVLSLIYLDYVLARSKEEPGET